MREMSHADLLLSFSSWTIIAPFEVSVCAVIDQHKAHKHTEQPPSVSPQGCEPFCSLCHISQPALHHAVICGGTLLACNRQWRRFGRPSAVFVKAHYEESNFIR